MNYESKAFVLVPKNCYRCGSEFPAAARERLCSACRKPKLARRPARAQALSFREGQIVNLITQAKMNKEIAYELHLTENTVKEYTNRIFKKLGVHSRVALVVQVMSKAHEAGA